MHVAFRVPPSRWRTIPNTWPKVFSTIFKRVHASGRHGFGPALKKAWMRIAFHAALLLAANRATLSRNSEKFVEFAYGRRMR